jgi:hypothetical protein
LKCEVIEAAVNEDDNSFFNLLTSRKLKKVPENSCIKNNEFILMIPPTTYCHLNKELLEFRILLLFKRALAFTDYCQHYSLNI